MDLGLSYIGVFLGAGLALIGGAYGISKLASAALEGTARQPEAAGSLQTMMIIPAAMIEGLGLPLLSVLLAALALNKGVPVAQTGAPAAASQSAH
jgi:F-type H+-transporting ATPase subunit c